MFGGLPPALTFSRSECLLFKLIFPPFKNELNLYSPGEGGGHPGHLLCGAGQAARQGSGAQHRG